MREKSIRSDTRGQNIPTKLEGVKMNSKFENDFGECCECSFELLNKINVG